MLVALIALTLLAAATAAGLSALALRRGEGGDAAARLDRLERELQGMGGLIREELRATRGELLDTLARQARTNETRFEGFTRAVNDGLKTSTEGFSHTQTTRLSETNQQMKALAETQKAGLEGVGGRIEALTTANAERQEKLRETLATSLETLRKENEAKLEQMRATVDEKLQGTLEQRLGDSFKLVSERLEAVHTGLGEMKTLAVGVGDLKRVLTNVKSRGGWGEVQLGALLENLLTGDQYAANVAVRPGSAERVEFAVRLPGKGDGEPVWLPIDSKFPHEDYDRLQAAQDAAIPEEVERCGAALERAVRLQAKTIRAKYVETPFSTDFAIMFLPTEGLFAEVVRRPGLIVDLQHAHHVTVTGPTTLTAMLNSLQMGFRSVAIEKRSSEVWEVLGKAKTEFRKYGDVWDRLAKQLAQAQNTVSDGGRRARAVERSLRGVETPEIEAEAAELLALPGLDEEDEAA